MQVAAKEFTRGGFGLALVAFVGGEALDGGVALDRLDHDGTRLDRVGFVGRTHPHGQQRALALDGDMARAAFDLLAAMEATLFAFGGRLHALAVEDGVARSASGPSEGHFPLARAQHDDRCLPDATLSPRPEVTGHSVSGREVVGQCAPAAARTQTVEDRFDGALLGMLGPGTARVWSLEEQGDPLPLPSA